MNTNASFRQYCETYFARLVWGFAKSLDDTGVRSWLNGHFNQKDFGGAADMATRIFPALCAWLSDKQRPRQVVFKGERVDVEGLVRKIFENAFDPKCAGYWAGDGRPYNQFVVESSVIGYGAWLVRDTVWPTLSESVKKNFAAWMEEFGKEAVRNNWQLFLICNHAARRALGLPFDQRTIDEAWAYINTLERGDGFMTDGPEGHFDDYQWWVFGTHEMFYLQMMGGVDKVLDERVRTRLRKRLEAFPYMFGADGSYTEYGRSLTYKFGRLGSPVLGYALGLWPHSGGMLQRLVRRHLEHYDNVGAIDRATHTIRQEVGAHGHADVRESYINTGHPYWAMHAFSALWQVPAEDAFWTGGDAMLPVEEGDFRRAVPAAGWLFAGAKATGHVLRYTMGTHHGAGSMQSKYAKFVYSSHFPMNIAAVEGDYGPDAALCLTDGVRWTHPTVYDKFAVDARWVRATYTLKIADHDVAVETVLAPLGDGEWHVRVHKLVVPVDGLKAVEGGLTLGYDSAEHVTKYVDALTSSVSGANNRGQRHSLIHGVRGYDRAVMPQAWRGRDRVNLVYLAAITPMLEATLRTGANVLVCVAHATRAHNHHAPKPQAIVTVDVTWEKDGTVMVTSPEGELRVPGLIYSYV